MLIISIASLVISLISLSFALFIFLKKQHKNVSGNVMQVTTDIDIGKCSVIGKNLESFDIKIYSNGKNYIYSVKNGEIASVKTDNMPEEFKY